MNEVELLNGLAPKIRGLRKNAELTISQLAELAGIDPGFLTYIENAKKMPSLLTVAKIAKALRMPISNLFEGAMQGRTGWDYRLEQQFYSLFRNHTAAQKADLLAVLKQLHNPRKVRALRQIMG